MPTVEEYGVEPIPQELKTAGWRDLFAINFTFFLNPVMYVLGALAVVDGGLPLWWAVLAMVVGQALAYAMLCIVAQPGVDYGLTGPVQMRSHLGYWGSRLLVVSVPRDRRDVLVRRAGADGSARDPGARTAR